MTVGQNFKIKRNQIGMTQQELSILTGISVQSIRKYESDKVVPKLHNLQSIATALGTSPSTLDESLKKTFNRWDEVFQSDNLSESSKMYEIMISLYGEELSSTVNDFLDNLTKEHQEQASDFIEFLMNKQNK